MKKLLLSIFTVSAIGVNAQNVTIPDANFKAYLVNEPTINTSGDSEIQVSEAAAFTGQIDCSGLSISDLTGIEAFTALPHLNCYNNQLTSIDVSNNTALTYLSCSVNQLTSLDVSQNTLLETLGCGSNQLSSLDVSNNTNLIGLHFYQNNIAVMDISNNGNLTQLNCLENALTYLNAANGNNTNFTNFNTTQNPNLTCIQVDDVAYSSTNWTSIDAASSFNTNCGPPPCFVNIPDANFKAYLIGNNAINTNGDAEIDCSEASAFNGTIDLTSSGVADLTGIEWFVNLDAFICNYNANITNFDLSSNTALTKIDIYDAPLLTSIDLSNNTNITYLRLESCYSLTSMNISNCTLVDTLNIGASTGFDYNFSVFPNLKWLNCYWTNPVGNTFDLSDNILLEYLDASYNSNMSTLDLTANTNLKILNISNSNFTSINYSYLTNLEFLKVDENSITSIDIAQNAALTHLHCDENLLTSVDVTNNLLLESFTCTDNQLTSLDVTNNLQLVQLQCSENQLSSIDLSANNLLEVLTLESNLFTSLSISNPNLRYLVCSDNQLTTLDVSQLTNLTTLFCADNDLTSLNVANGNNVNFVNPEFGFATPFYAINNPNLTCINVDDASYSTSNWTNIDATAAFSENCATLGIEESELVLSVYPNPTVGSVTFNALEKIKTIEIYTVAGQKVADFSNVNTIDISHLPSGIYTATIQTSNGKTAFKKLVKE